MKFIMNSFMIAGFVFLSACVSEEERQARRDNVYDLSGKYQTVEDSEIQFSFEVTNESGKHDIFVTLNRTTPLTDEERELLSKLKQDHNLSDETIFNQPTQITFGKGSSIVSYFEGGDNISYDFGKSSRFHVCSSDNPEYKSNKQEADKKDIILKIRYCLTGSVKKESKEIIDGRLILSVYSYYHKLIQKEESQPETTEGEKTEFESEAEGEIEFDYKAKKVTATTNS